MKKVSLSNKLSFKKETIASLNNLELNTVVGGQINTYSFCATHCIIPNTASNCASCHHQ